MALNTRTFNRKSFPVEAVRVTNTNFEDVRAWCDGEEVPKSGKTPRHFKVPVIRPMSHTQTKARVGDWVLFANNGFKVYPDAAFRRYFEPVGTGFKATGDFKKPDVFPGEPVEMQESLTGPAAVAMNSIQRYGFLPPPTPAEVKQYHDNVVQLREKHAGRAFWPVEPEDMVE